MSAPGGGPPPGWYPDPWSPGSVRWWDGTTWTAYAQPMWQGPPMPPQLPPHVLAERRAAVRPRVRTALIIIGIGALILVPSTIVAVRTVIDRLTDAPAFSIPGSTQVHLDSGHYIVWEQTGSKSTTGPITFSTNSGTSFGAAQVTVTAVGGGEPIPVADPIGRETLTIGSDVYTGAAGFRAPSTGDYRVVVQNSASGEALVSRSLGDTVGLVAGWIVAAAIGFIILAVGVIILIVAAVRRGRVSSQP